MIIVKELTPKLQIQFVPELRYPVPDVLGLYLYILFMIKSDFHSAPLFCQSAFLFTLYPFYIKKRIFSIENRKRPQLLPQPFSLLYFYLLLCSLTLYFRFVFLNFLKPFVLALYAAFFAVLFPYFSEGQAFYRFMHRHQFGEL